MRKGRAALALLSLVLTVLAFAACKGGGGKTSSGPSPEEVTKQAIELLREHNTRANGGKSWRWVISPIPIWFDPGIARADVEGGIGLWMGAVPALRFEIAAGPRSSGIEMLFTTIDTHSGVLHCLGACACMLGTNFNRPVPNVASFATILIDNTRSCRDYVATIAHEIGHAIGIGGHPNDGSVMATTASRSVSPALREALLLLYTNPPGTVF